MNESMPIDNLYENHHQHQYEEDGCGSLGSRSNLSMSNCSKHDIKDSAANDDYQKLDVEVKGIPQDIDTNDLEVSEIELTKDEEAAVAKEREMLCKENTGRLQNILDNIKNSTKAVLQEMIVFLQETEEVEKSYIRCRAKTQKESRRLEQVEPDVAGATQRYLSQASAQLFGGRDNETDDMATMIK